jgi:predicted dehydrogenase
VAVWVDYDEGKGIAEASMDMPGSYPLTSSIRMLCERGAATYFFEAGVGDAAETAADSSGASRLGTANEHLLTVYRDDPRAAEVVSLEAVDLWRPELAHFLEAIEAGRPPEQGTGEQARAALAVALAANRSLESGVAELV